MKNPDMIVLRISLFIITTIVLSSCCDEEQALPESEYILFGHFYGFCQGEECIEIFKLTSDELYEDTLDQYPLQDNPYAGQYIPLSNEKYMIARDLFDAIPEELLNVEESVIGSPDASDGGGIYFAIVTSTDTRFWLIDQFTHNIPDFLHPFVSKVNQSIAEIND